MKLKFKLFLFTVMSLFVLTGMTSVAATPPVNAEIGNQATLLYVDGSGTTRTVLSNIVITRVNAVHGVELTPDLVTHGLTDEVVNFIHTLTNLGNTPDSYLITHVADNDYETVNLLVNDGDGFTPIIGNVTLDAGKSATVIVTTSSSIADGSAGNIILTATSVGNGLISDTATDELIITAGPVINTYKIFDQIDGAAGDSITSTFHILNTGGDIGSDYVLTDLLDSNFDYLGAAQVKTEANGWVDINPGETVDGITLSVVDQEISITIPGGVPLQTGESDPLMAHTAFRFNLRSKPGLLAQTIANTATFEYDNSTASDLVTGLFTNTATFTILQYTGVTFTGETVPSAEQGALVRFTNTITNTGNGRDTFDVSLVTNEFPAGTSFFLSFDGSALFETRVPLIDTTASGTIDTGFLEAGESKNIILWAQLPINARGADFKISKFAESTFDLLNEIEVPTSATALDQVLIINAATVDITNNFPIGDLPISGIGIGIGPEVSPVTEIDILPGNTGYFNLYINNTNINLSDEYTLEVSTDPTFKETVLPEGIEVKFATGAGSEISGTGSVLPGTFYNVRANVSVAGNALAGDISLYFRARSAATGAIDIKHDLIKISVLRNLSISPNNSGETYAGSSIYYNHTITNGGNVKEGSGGDSSSVILELADILGGFTSTVWYDVDGNGILEKGVDTLITDLATIGGLNPGESIKVFVEVDTALNVIVNSLNTTTVRLNVSKGIYNVFHSDVLATNITKIIKDYLDIIKFQGTTEDPTFDPNIVITYVTTPLTASPEEYIYYRIVVTNTGLTTVEDVMIEDSIPQYTTLSFGNNISTAGVDSKPSWKVGLLGGFEFAQITPNEGERGSIKADVGSLAPGQSAELYFNVIIDGSQIAD